METSVQHTCSNMANFLSYTHIVSHLEDSNKQTNIQQQYWNFRPKALTQHDSNFIHQKKEKEEERDTPLNTHKHKHTHKHTQCSH